MIALVPKSPLRSCEGTDGRSSRRSSDAARSPACRRRCHAIPGWSGKGPLKSPILLRSPRGGGLGSLASCCKGGGAFFTASRGHLRYRWHTSDRAVGVVSRESRDGRCGALVRGGPCLLYTSPSPRDG